MMDKDREIKQDYVCASCNSKDISHEEKIGRGRPPKGYVKSNNKKMSWLAIWDAYTCKECGEVKKVMRD